MRRLGLIATAILTLWLATTPARAQPAYPGPGAATATDAFVSPGFAPVAVTSPSPTEPSFAPGFATPTTGFGVPTAAPLSQPLTTEPSIMPIVTGSPPPGVPAAPAARLPTQITLNGPTTTVDIGITGSPAISGFELTFGYDPAFVAATGASPGPFLTGAGGDIQPQLVNLNAPGTVSYGLALTNTSTWPTGDGVLARITLAAVAETGDSQVQLTALTLIDATGQRLIVDPTSAKLVVAYDPPPPAQTQVAENVASLAVATPLPPPPPTPPPTSLGSLLANLPGGGIALAWLGALMLGLLVAAVGWMMGRRPVV